MDDHDQIGQDAVDHRPVRGPSLKSIKTGRVAHDIDDPFSMRSQEVAMPRWLVAALLAILGTVDAVDVEAKVVRVEIERREDVLNGRPFGSVGPYQKIVGTVYFAFDASNPMNARTVDIENAPRKSAVRAGRPAPGRALRPGREVEPAPSWPDR